MFEQPVFCFTTDMFIFKDKNKDEGNSKILYV